MVNSNLDGRYILGLFDQGSLNILLKLKVIYFEQHLPVVCIMFDNIKSQEIEIGGTWMLSFPSSQFINLAFLLKKLGEKEMDKR